VRGPLGFEDPQGLLQSGELPAAGWVLGVVVMPGEDRGFGTGRTRKRSGSTSLLPPQPPRNGAATTGSGRADAR
jgi:hypothetical protein